MVSTSDPEDFNHLKFGLCLFPKALNGHACSRSLKIPQFGVRGGTDLEKSLVFSLHARDPSYS